MYIEPSKLINRRRKSYLECTRAWPAQKHGTQRGHYLPMFLKCQHSATKIWHFPVKYTSLFFNSKSCVSMGNCFSKTEEVHPPSVNKNAVKGKATPPQNAGRTLGENTNTQSSRAAAANAAEQRYKAQQDKLAESREKLKKMEKISRKDKGLA